MPTKPPKGPSSNPDHPALRAFEAYLKDQGIAPSSIRVYLRIAAYWADEGAPHAYFRRLNDKGATPEGTARPILAAARSWLRWQHDERPLPKLRLQKGTHREALSPEGLEKFLAALNSSDTPPIYKTILSLMPYTGLRVGEVTGLRWPDIRVSEGGPYLHIVGKGDVTRDVPLIPEATRILDAWGASEESQRAQANGIRWIFPSQAPMSPDPESHPSVSGQSVRDHLNALLQDPKLRTIADMTPHTLRHTCATLLLENDVSLAHIQKILGHADIETTQRYLHPTLRGMRKGLETLEPKGPQGPKGPGKPT